MDANTEFQAAVAATGIKLVGNIGKMECATPGLRLRSVSKWVESGFGPFRVISAKAGMQKLLNFLDSGSRCAGL